MSEFSLKASVLIAGVAMLMSCTGRQYADEQDSVVEVPDAYSSVALEGVEVDGWCSDFGSPELAGLVDRAFEENLDLRQAWARLEQADAIAAQTRAGFWPTIDAQVQAGAQRQQTFGPTGPVVDEAAAFGASLGAAYEVDLWGRLRATSRAAGYDVMAARADVEAMAISVTSQIAEAWFDAVLQREKLLLLQEQIDIAQKYLELTELRLSQGAATALDVNQQNQQIEQLRGQMELVHAAEATAENRLAVLLGKAASQSPEVTVEDLPELPALPAVGVPADLVTLRPDVRAAEARLRAADARTAAAARAKLPTLRLSASLFVQASELAELLDDVFWSIVGVLGQNIFSGGRLDAEQQRAEAAAKERLYAYAKAVVQAIAEVENALVLEGQQNKFLEHLEAQRENADLALSLARDRYRSGALDYLRVLTALQSLQQIEQSLLDAQRQRLSYRLQLCRALGGQWTRELQAPAENFGEER